MWRNRVEGQAATERGGAGERVERRRGGEEWGGEREREEGERRGVLRSRSVVPAFIC